jgi:hypothetical protein
MKPIFIPVVRRMGRPCGQTQRRGQETRAEQECDEK